MIFVHWDDGALDDLADIWVAATATDRIELEAAVLRINRNLEANPMNEGESRFGNWRVLIEPLLTIWFTFDDLIDTVVVFHTHRPKRR